MNFRQLLSQANFTHLYPLSSSRNSTKQERVANPETRNLNTQHMKMICENCKNLDSRLVDPDEVLRASANESVFNSTHISILGETPFEDSTRRMSDLLFDLGWSD